MHMFTIILEQIGHKEHLKKALKWYHKEGGSKKVWLNGDKEISDLEAR